MKVKLQLVLLIAHCWGISSAQLNSSREKFLVVDPKGHNAVVNEVMYSPLTRELISVSDDKTIRLWDLEDQVLNRTLRIKSQPTGPDGMIYAAALSKDGRHLAVAGYSFYNDIKVIDLQSGQISVVLSGHKNVVTSLDFSPDGKYLASGSADESVRIWEKGSKYLYEPKATLYQHQRRVNDLQFSPDGTMLVSVSDDETTRVWTSSDFGTGADPLIYRNHLGPVKKVACGNAGFLTGGEDGIVNFWQWNGAVEQVVQFGSPVLTLEVSDFLDVAFLAGDRQLLVNLAQPTKTVSLFSSNQSISAAYFSDDKKLFLGQGRAGNLIAIDLATQSPIYALRGQGRDFEKLAINKDKVGFAEEGKLVGYFDFTKEQIVRDQSLFKDFKAARTTDGTFNFIPIGNNQLTFGSQFSVTNITRDGKILCYTLLPDGKIAVGSDRTLKIYNADGSLVKELEGHNGQILSLVSNNSNLFSYGGDQIIKVWSLGDYSLTYNLFITKDYEWILWGQSGKYTASAGGEQYLNWQINRNENELSEFFDVSTYGNTFLKESVTELTEAKRDEPQEVILPAKPEIKWITPELYQTETNERQIRIKATIFSDKPVTKTRILVSGTAIPSRRGVSEVSEIDEIIELRSYKTTIEIFASTEDSKIISEKRVIFNPDLIESGNSGTQIIDPDKKPNLYFLGIGVSEFQNREFNLTYADDDANSMYEIFTQGSSSLYNKIEGKTILNSEATKSNILSAMKELTGKVQPKDLVVIFVASHGINDKGFYYVLTHDADKANLTGTCLQWNEIADVLSGLSCRVLLFLDTCHSGALGTNLASSGKLQNNTEALRELGSVEVGVVIMSGSTGEESSLESAEWAHGVFTLSLIKGLKEREADLKSDGLIYLRELDLYISNNVNELTNGRQNPTTQKPSTISKFLIY